MNTIYFIENSCNSKIKTLNEFTLNLVSRIWFIFKNINEINEIDLIRLPDNKIKLIIDKLYNTYLKLEQ